MIKSLSTIAWLAYLATLFCFPGETRAGTESYGLLYLEINPVQTEIVMDGHLLGVNVWLLSLPPGSHDLYVRKFGYKTYFQQIDIMGGQSLSLDINLEPASESVREDSNLGLDPDFQ